MMLNLILLLSAPLRLWVCALIAHVDIASCVLSEAYPPPVGRQAV